MCSTLTLASFAEATSPTNAKAVLAGLVLVNCTQQSAPHERTSNADSDKFSVAREKQNVNNSGMGLRERQPSVEDEQRGDSNDEFRPRDRLNRLGCPAEIGRRRMPPQPSCNTAPQYLIKHGV